MSGDSKDIYFIIGAVIGWSLRIFIFNVIPAMIIFSIGKKIKNAIVSVDEKPQPRQLSDKPDWSSVALMSFLVVSFVIAVVVSTLD